MKKLFLALAVVFTAMCAAMPAHGMDASEIASELNERCPMKYSDGMVLEQVEIADGNIVFSYSIPDDTFANLADLGGILHDALVAELTTSPDPDIKQMLVICKAGNTPILQKFYNSQKKSFVVTITPADIK